MRALSWKEGKTKSSCSAIKHSPTFSISPELPADSSVGKNLWVYVLQALHLPTASKNIHPRLSAKRKTVFPDSTCHPESPQFQKIDGLKQKEKRKRGQHVWSGRKMYWKDEGGKCDRKAPNTLRLMAVTPIHGVRRRLGSPPPPARQEFQEKKVTKNYYWICLRMFESIIIKMRWSKIITYFTVLEIANHSRILEALHPCPLPLLRRSPYSWDQLEYDNYPST